jgi:hypothetical protein
MDGGNGLVPPKTADRDEKGLVKHLG